HRLARGPLHGRDRRRRADLRPQPRPPARPARGTRAPPARRAGRPVRLLLPLDPEIRVVPPALRVAQPDRRRRVRCTPGGRGPAGCLGGALPLRKGNRTARMQRIAPPDPHLPPEELIARAVALRPKLIERQAETEELARSREETPREFLDAGFYRLYIPRR